MDATLAAHGHELAHGWDNDRKVRLGMLFYVLTDVTFAVFLLVSYIWERAYNVNSAWFSLKLAAPDQGATNLLVLAMVASGVLYLIGHVAISRFGGDAVFAVCATLALALVVVAAIGQARFMGDQQFAAQDGTFASSWIVLSGYHIYHLVFGAFLGLGLAIRAWQGRYSRERHLGVTTIGYFWYWMALYPVVVWLMMVALPAKI
jgi:heme/copper-type cytochrome/quinol oxidase subunit 3